MQQLVTPNLGITYTGGFCQKASENSVGVTGVYPSATVAWDNNLQHTGNPPSGFYVPVYLKLISNSDGDVAWSCADGTVAAAAQPGTHRGLFKYPSLRAYVDDYAKNNGGAIYRGWGEYVGKIQVIKEVNMEMFNEGDRINWLAETGTNDSGQYKNLVGQVTFKAAIEKMRTDGLLRVNTGDVVNVDKVFPTLGTAIKGKVWKNAVYQDVLKYNIPTVTATVLKPGEYKVQ